MASKPLLQDSAKQSSYGSDSVEMSQTRVTNLRTMKNKGLDDPPAGSAMFLDGRRRVDFVLVYKNVDEDRAAAATKRDYFHTSLRKQGLQLEEIPPELEEEADSGLSWVLVHAPFSTLTRHAEEMGWKMPVREADEETKPTCDPKVFQTPLDTHRRIVDNYAALFKRSGIDSFLNYDAPNKFFTSAQRSRLVYDILQNTQFSPKSSDLGIDRLEESKVYEAAYPLHEGNAKADEHGPDADDSQETARQELRNYWGRWGVWYKNQPLDHIREYFGEATAFYFAWLGMYTVWLVPATILGLIVVFYGAATVSSSIVEQTCDSNLTYCPACSACDTTFVNTSCMYAKLSRMFDNELTLAFAVIMSFWATFYLEFWKRKTTELAYRWDVLGEEEEAERPRPQYCIKATSTAENPITAKMEPFFPPSERVPRFFAGWSIVITMFILLLIVVIGVIMYRTIIVVVLLGSSFKAEAPVLSSLTGSILSLVAIIIMSFIYQKLALFLTDWEMHRTDDDYSYHLTLKMYLFEFVNYYATLFYIAFFKGRFSGYPCDYTMFLGYRLEECSVSGCFYELSQQLLIILVGKQIFNNVLELLIPKLKMCVQRWKLKRKYGNLAAVEKEAWQRDYYELEPFGGLFGEYLEMVIQFGFITVFVAAMPLAPLFALLNNIIEIRLDAKKFISQYRRPVAMKTDGIGIWHTILTTVVKLAVIVNAFLIAFTSEIIPQMFYRLTSDEPGVEGFLNYTLTSYTWDESNPNASCLYTGLSDANMTTCFYKKYIDMEYYYHLLVVRVVFVILFEHVVFVVGHLIDLFVPDIPRSLYLKIKREDYLAVSALSEDLQSSKEELGVQ